MSGIAERWAVVQSRLERACARAGRDPASVRVVAVSKTFGPDAVREGRRPEFPYLGRTGFRRQSRRFHCARAMSNGIWSGIFRRTRPETR